MSNIIESKIDHKQQLEDKWKKIIEFSMKIYKDRLVLGISNEQHYKDAREFLVPITKFYELYNKLKNEAVEKRKQTINVKDRMEINKDVEFKTKNNNEIIELHKNWDKFVNEDRDEYSFVKKIIEIYKTITYNHVQNIKNHLEFYLTGDIKTMCDGDKNEIEMMHSLMQLSLL